MRYVIGYTPDARGRDAIALASAIGRAQDAQLDLVHVLSNPAPADASYPPERAVQEFRLATADGWLDEGLAMIPRDVQARKHVRFADSFTEGLLEAAAELDAALIVVGAARKGLLKRFTVGSVANALLHASPVPVALAPSGYQAPERIARMTCAVGTRAGADTLLDVAVDAASRRNVPLRLISLITFGAEDGRHQRDHPIRDAHKHADAMLSSAIEAVAEHTRITTDIALGSTIEEAVDELEWDDAEIVLIGSSRLAQSRRIFMGSTANKMLRALPVPLIVVPRDHARLDQESARTAALS